MTQVMKGSYILLIQLCEGQVIKAGRVPDSYFPGGYYAYVGSAMGGLKSRVNRHLKENKRPKWHIDYLLQKASIKSIILCETDNRVECAIAQALNPQFDSIPSFGSSDCKCRSHLFFSGDKSHMKSTILTTLNSLGIKPRLRANLSVTT